MTTRRAHPRPCSSPSSVGQIVAFVVVLLTFAIWSFAVTAAQEASWQRYQEAGCPTNPAACAIAYEKFESGEWQ